MDAARCVHQRVRHASCTACETACPTNAWQSTGDGLTFDADACDRCGLCVAACPTQALTLPAPQPLLARQNNGAQAAWWRCERAGPPDHPANAPCLLALSPAWLHLAARRLGVHEHVFVPGDCSRCARGAGLPEWQRQWRGQAALAASRGFALHLRLAPAADWPTSPDAGAPADLGRRRFFRRAAPPAPVRSSPPLSSAREDIWASAPTTPPPAPVAPLWQVDFDRTRCTLCLACVHVCPTNTIFFIAARADSTTTRFGFDLQKCTGCGLCTAACDSGALAPPKPTPSDGPPAHGPESWPLRTQRCQRCGVDFRQFASADGNPHLTCPTCAQGRPARAGRIVQTSPP
ncbi:4Fe-4S binding protein [Ottowia testudinis]|uniref:4Fe-4S binding protein n=1 Tax=Ottowia testudinis TaxID=2816950 RepID=A0A975H2Q7_9BURK|nr:4Fe-4S binding protein [Ottowia testudinis]QTD45108.1 4Fe-4S binding protein [Ottowia testudinis]